MKRFTLLSTCCEPNRSAAQNLFCSILPHFVFLLLFVPAPASAQAPGSPGADRIGEESVSESALGGTLLTLHAAPSSLFGNPAHLTELGGSGLSLSWSQQSTFERSYEVVGAVTVEDEAAIGIGVSFSGVSPIDFRNANEEAIGQGAFGTLVLGAGGSIGIGPGSLGGAIRLLSYSATNAEASGLGIAIDLGATLTFRQRLNLSLLLRNLGGVVNATYRTGLHETIPVDARVGASYTIPIEKSFSGERGSPTGVYDRVEERPIRYILAGLEIRSAAIDDRLILAGSVEALPFLYADENAIGFRAGLNSRGQIGGGVFLDAPLNNLASASRISFGYRYSPEVSENALFFALDISP